MTTLYQSNNKSKDKMDQYHKKIDKINKEISSFIETYQSLFNANWGELMRAGQEESLIANQVEKYACIYVTKVVDLLKCSPNIYFRPMRRVLPHEL